MYYRSTDFASKNPSPSEQTIVIQRVTVNGLLFLL